MPDPIHPIDASAVSPPLPDAPGFEHFMVDTPGLQTHVATIGDGDPVVMLHGFPQHWWQWRTIGPEIAAAGYRVLCPDLRGAGWSVADSPVIDRETRLDDLLALFDALSIERAHVISHDMGVLTAMQLSYEHPERVRSAIQLAVLPGFAKFHYKLAPAFQHLPRFIWHAPQAPLRDTFSGRYVAQPMSDETIDAYLAPMERPVIDAAVRPLTRKVVLPEAMHIMRGRYRRRRLTVPTLVVYGRQDHPTTEELMNKMCRNPHEYADRVEFAYIDNAAHFITDDAPEAVATLAKDWLARNT